MCLKAGTLSAPNMAAPSSEQNQTRSSFPLTRGQKAQEQLFGIPFDVQTFFFFENDANNQRGITLPIC